MRAGVELSYLGEERQRVVYGQVVGRGNGGGGGNGHGNDTKIIITHAAKISMAQATKIRKADKQIDPQTDPGFEAFAAAIADILAGKAREEKQAPKKIIRIKLQHSTVSSYFKDSDTEDAINERILEALEFFHQHRGKIAGF
jgi:hypothetical protein